MPIEKWEKHPDTFDNASELEAMQRNAAIAAVQKQLKETHPDFNGKDCVDCDIEIPELRLQMCRVRCVGCQTDLEYKNRTRRK